MEWDPLSTLIGIFIGMVLIIILGWISWSSRTFVFEVCPRDFTTCRQSNYLNNPANALADGFNTREILFLDSNDRLMYHRPPKDLCVPGVNQDVHIVHPQYCTFKTAEGNTFEGRNNFFGSPFYTSISPVNGTLIDVTTGANCEPQNNTGSAIVTSGSPKIKWDSAT